MTASAVAVHWLVQVARRAGLDGADEFEIVPQTPPVQAWDAVARHCGVTGEALAVEVAAFFRLKVANLEAGDPVVTKLIEASLARKHHIVPLRQSDREIVVATSDPTDIAVEQEIGFASSRLPVFEVAPPRAIGDALDRRYGGVDSVELLLGTVPEAEMTDAVRVVEQMQETVDAEDAETTPVIRLTNLILQEATSAAASDIHIEPGRGQGVVRFRIDGVLRQFMELPAAALNRVVSRIKILGDLDIADRIRPQDGSTHVDIRGRKFELRISTVPTRGAEKAVLRILDPETTHSLDELGLLEKEYERLLRLLSQRDGIVIVTGPTGSGKTTTLYGALQRLATGDVNIMTVEDPVEYELAGITQIQVEPKQGVTFASALRAILRQDPDVILVGEIRDLETATVAAQSALTGHLVLATLHTNDAVGAVARLTDLGLDRPTIANALRGVIAQRLVRRVCPECAEPVGNELSGDEQRLADAFGAKPAVRAVGCDVCGGTGYRGRMPVQEVLVVTSEITELIADGASQSDVLRAAVSAGMRRMHQTGLERLASGETSLGEIERVLGDVDVEFPEVLLERQESEPEPAPAAAEQPTGISQPADTAPPPASSSPPEEPGPERILVMDDDPVNRGLARTLLEANGFGVAEAEDGEKGLAELTRNGRYDLIVMDLNMPVLDGRGVLKAVRDMPEMASLPVIVLTGSEPDDSEIELINLGADDYIRKPIDPPRFVARVKATLRRAVK